jgi:hypothetical protein
MEMVQPSTTPVKDFNPQNAKEHFGRKFSLIFFDIFNKYHFFVSLDGTIIDSVTKQPVRLNHVKCLLRNDYLSGNPEIHGSLLNGVIESFLVGIIKAVKLASQTNPEYVQVEDVKDEYLT